MFFPNLNIFSYWDQLALIVWTNAMLQTIIINPMFVTHTQFNYTFSECLFFLNNGMPN